jgi:amino acid permease (GABA permease)
MSFTTRASQDQRSAGAVLLDDDQRLHELGYPRKLSRRLTWFDNFAVSFTIINIIAGVFTGFGLGFVAGGPRTLVWGWIVVSLLILFVGMAMAEVCSAYPTSGALYYWAAKLAKRHNAAWSWFTGWLNFAGQIAGTAATDFAAANFINLLAALEWPSYSPTKFTTLGIFAVILLIHALLNTYTVKLVGLFNRISVWWLLFGALIIVGVLVFKPSHHQSASFVFTQFENGTGFSSGLYATMIGLLSISWVFTGFDASAHMTEETSKAAISAPRGIVRSIAYSGIGGFFLLLSVLWAVQNYSAESSAGVPSAQIVLDAVGGSLAKVLLLIVIGALLFCGMANLTSNSRQIFAFSRDGAIPGSKLWHSVNPRTGTPVKSVWFAAVGAFILVLPSLWSSVAFYAVVSVNVIGLFGSYAIPIFLRLRRGDDFEPGPWTLGKWGKPVAIVAVVWVAISSLVFLLPQFGPITAHNFNYAPIALAVVLLISAVWWFVTAKRTFNGPISYGTPEELAALESEMI